MRWTWTRRRSAVTVFCSVRLPTRFPCLLQAHHHTLSTPQPTAPSKTVLTHVHRRRHSAVRRACWAIIIRNLRSPVRPAATALAVRLLRIGPHRLDLDGENTKADNTVRVGDWR